MISDHRGRNAASWMLLLTLAACALQGGRRENLLPSSAPSSPPLNLYFARAAANAVGGIVPGERSVREFSARRVRCPV